MKALPPVDPHRQLMSNRRHLRYARGFYELGMLKEAAASLELIIGPMRLEAEVMLLQIDVHVTAHHWELVAAMTLECIAKYPGESGGWISRAYALRELNRIEEARETLLKAEALHGNNCSILHYNLACYHCLLGETNRAKDRLAWAFKMERTWKADALTDPDLEALRKEIAAMK